jgi:acyl carrier protein
LTAGPDVGRDITGRAGGFDAVFDRMVTAVLRSPTMPSDDMDLTAVGLDSFGMLNLMMALEDEFGEVWPLEHLTMSAGVTTVGDLRRVARETLAGDAG